MKALDLFCCDGGAAMGLHRAGFDDIVGIDIEPHPNYPFDFIQADCLRLPIKDFSSFDFIWASPPCQAFTDANQKKLTDHPDLIEPTRLLLKTTGKPFVIENVDKAPIKKNLLLCGQMFNLKILRHRIFEIHGFRAEQPRHPNHIGTVFEGDFECVCTAALGVGAKSSKHIRKELRDKRNAKLDPKLKIERWQAAMDLEHISHEKYLAEAVPPAYSEYIAKEFFRTRNLVCG